MRYKNLKLKRTSNLTLDKTMQLICEIKEKFFGFSFYVVVLIHFSDGNSIECYCSTINFMSSFVRTVFSSLRLIDVCRNLSFY